ncbi:formyltetrahydrofolate deformylase [Formosimonas limnophila]|uniref:Formyltetrahydrofolate deformylase n=1 Tax=Formosimonas limnophila TaxID=1384487 RepID=A0A8J3CMY1_9BURK|nr:formyltetrahydrofolate deformylase [Formosimonas limnophila]GHA72981.1 formyltetrahydrofolate deformylase [Formosimonas limnophila]
MTNPNFILTLSCPDQMGIVHTVSGFLFERGGNIIDSAQFDDQDSDRFFMRVHFEERRPDVGLDKLKAEFEPIAQKFNMDWQMFDGRVKPRVLIMVSKIGHCLNDLLFRHQSGNLPVEIATIVSNHPDFYQLAASYNIPFHHLPLLGASDEQKAAQEARIIEVVEQQKIDVVVLARYMQILSNDLCQKLSGRAINIHHSFLPSFKGAKPYHQAFNKGVKLIGATAHFVTADLDEGPIIEQDIARVDHSMTPDELTAIGRDVECVTLARAVKWHAEHRVLLNDKKTVVFK